MNLIAEREVTHGDFPAKARFIQAFKLMIRTAEGYDDLSPAQRESLDMIAVKIGRILFGNPDHPDHWDDIAGYAQLCAEELSRG